MPVSSVLGVSATAWQLNLILLQCNFHHSISQDLSSGSCTLLLHVCTTGKVRFLFSEGLRVIYTPCSPLPNNCRTERSVLEAASNGATDAVGLVANVVANLIAFLAVLAFINAALSWLGELVDIQGLTFQVKNYTVWLECPSRVYLSSLWTIEVFLTHSEIEEGMDRRIEETELKLQGNSLGPDLCYLFFLFLDYLFLFT